MPNPFPSSTDRTITFKGRFGDFNQKQTFKIFHPDGSNTAFEYKQIKSLFYQTFCSQIANQVAALFPLCQITSRVVSFPKVRWGTAFEFPDLCFSTIDDYEYLIPADWKVNGVPSDGTTWIAGTNTATITSDLSTGNGNAIRIRPRNICAPNLKNYPIPGIIPITRPAPSLSIKGDDAICSGSKTYRIDGLPAGATVIWSISNTSQASIPIPSTEPTVDVTIVGSGSGSVILSATVTFCGTTYPPVNKEIFLGPPYFGATYFNGISNNPVMFYDPNNPTTSVNNVCSEYGPYYIDATPSATNATTWAVPPGFPYNGTLTWEQNSANRAKFYFTGGIAYLKGTVSNACGSYSQTFAFRLKNCLPIGTNPCQYTIFTVSPNPASDVIYIEILSKPLPPPPCLPSTPQINEGIGYVFSVVNIYDQTGTLRKSQQANGVTEMTVPINSLTTGIYVVEIISGTYKERHQIIVL